MKLIPLSKEKGYSIVDDEDYEKLSKLNWYLDSQGYANCCNSRRYKIRLHRFILNPKKRECIDHINRNKLDNRKENLRICSRQENLKNCTKYKNNKSGYKGVYFCPFQTKGRNWRMQIVFNRKVITGWNDPVCMWCDQRVGTDNLVEHEVQNVKRSFHKFPNCLEKFTSWEHDQPELTHRQLLRKLGGDDRILHTETPRH